MQYGSSYILENFDKKTFCYDYCLLSIIFSDLTSKS